jgi:hypothetical protein
MRLASGRSLIPVIRVAMIVLVTVFVYSALGVAANSGAKPDEQDVAYRRIGTGDYQSFLINWDEKSHPVLYALIRTPAQYAALFHPAPVTGGDKRPFAPGAEIYTREQILVIGRVMTAPEDMDKVFEVERVVEKGRELTLYYRFHEPGIHTTFTVKSYLALLIPKHEYRKVTFFENGKRVGELKTAQEEWSVPAMAPEPDKPSAGRGK